MKNGIGTSSGQNADRNALPADVEDHPRTAEFPSPMFWTGDVTPHYFRLMQIPLISGRAFTEADGPNASPVILISASTARRFWPGANPIGKHIRRTGETGWRTVIGVVADVRQFDLANHSPGSISGAMYMPYAQAIQAGSIKYHYAHGKMLRFEDRAPDKTARDELLELLKANPGILSGAFTKLTEQHGLGRNRGRDFLNDGLQSGAIRLEKEGRKRRHFGLRRHTGNLSIRVRVYI